MQAPIPYVTDYGPIYPHSRGSFPPLPPQAMPYPVAPPVPAQGYTANHSQFSAQISRQRKRAYPPAPAPIPGRQTAPQSVAPTPLVHEEVSVIISLAYLKDKTHKLQNIGVRFR